MLVINVAIKTLKYQCLDQHHKCALPFFVNDEVFVFAKKGGERLGDFCKILNESSVEADVPEKAPRISYSTWKREVLDELYLGLVHF